MRFLVKSHQRSQRRFERENHLAQTLRLAHQFGIGDFKQLPEEREAEALRWAMRVHQNRKKCSCWMCGNRRRLHKGDERFNFQERKLRQQSRLEVRDFWRET